MRRRLSCTPAIMANSPAPKAQKIAEARAATQGQTTQIAQKQEQLATILTGPRFSASEIYRVRRALNGIAVYVSRDKLAELRSLPGVKAVIPIQLEYPTNSTSVPFLGTPQVWGTGLGLNVKGNGIKIGIIDTGIDYQHAELAGPAYSRITRLTIARSLLMLTTQPPKLSAGPTLRATAITATTPQRLMPIRWIATDTDRT